MAFFFIQCYRGGYMLTKILKKRIILTTAVLFALSLMYILPKEKLYTLDKVDEELVYEDGKRINNSCCKRNL